MKHQTSLILPQRQERFIIYKTNKNSFLELEIENKKDSRHFSTYFVLEPSLWKYSQEAAAGTDVPVEI